jgi:16S rRNA (adenine1518-N6/adenine1519-N6)-dimethyltransferase
VDSAVVRIVLKKNKEDKIDEKEFMKMVKIGFAQKRKLLKKNLANGLGLEQNYIQEKIKKIGLNEKVRAQELSIHEWLKIFLLLNKN